MKRKFFVLILFLVTIPVLFAAKTFSASFTYPVSADLGPRALGLAGAFVGIADDASDFYWNPAGLGFAERSDIYVGYVNIPSTNNWSGYVSYGHPSGAITAIRSAKGAWNGTSGKGTTDMLILSQAIPMGDFFSVGLNLKAESLDGGNTIGYGSDFSVLLKTEYFRLGFTAQDIATIIGGSRTAAKYRIGAGIGPFGTVMIGGQLDMHEMQISQTSSAFIPQIRAGVEGWLADEHFGLRLGYSIIPLSLFDKSLPNYQYCAVGFSIKVQYFSLDYAYTIPFSTGITENHNIAMTFLWGQTKAEIAAELKAKADSEEKARKAEELLKMASFSETLARKREQIESAEREKLTKDQIIQKLDAENKKMRSDSLTMAHEFEMTKIDLAKTRADSASLSSELSKTRSDLEILDVKIKKGELVSISEQEKANQLEEKLKQIKAYATVDPDLKIDLGKTINKQVIIKDTPEGLMLRLNRDTFFKGRTMVSMTYKTLDSTAEALLKYKGHAVTINGYTDSIGSKSGNLKISQSVAESVREYLISKGVPEDKVFANGYGPANPIAPNTTKAGRALNRRIQLIIYKQ